LDLFDAYPELKERGNSALRGRSVRLISLTGMVYDADSFYFELGEQRNWGHLPGGGVAIGVGTPKVQPNDSYPRHYTLIQHVRKQWRVQTELFPAGHGYVLDEQRRVHILDDTPANVPYLFILTPPRLGGGVVPDALAQAVYLLPVARRQTNNARTSMLKVSREALPQFLAPESWALSEIRQEPWAVLRAEQPLPVTARLRPILALRGLRHLIEAEAIPGLLSF
jgi:hypothetical protein